METNFLRDYFLKFIRSMRYDLGLYRVVAVFAAISLPLFRAILPEDAYDPIWTRVAISGFILFFFGLSFVNGYVRRNISHFGHLVIYMITLWAAWLAFQNAYSNPYLVNFFVVISFAGANFRHLRAWFPYAILVLATGLAACMLPQEKPSQLWSYFALLPFTLLLSAVATAFRITLAAEFMRQRRMVNQIFESSPDAILMANAETLLVYASNQNAHRLFGVGGLRSTASLHEKLTVWLKNHLSVPKDGERIGRRVSELQTLQDESFWGEVVVSELPSDDGLKLLISISDISQQRKTAQHLQLSDDILKLVDHIVLVCDAEAQIVYATPSVKTILGYDVAEVLGVGWWKIKEKSGQDITAEIEYLKAFASGKRVAKTANYEVRHIDKQGKEQWILWKDTLTESGLVMGVGMPHTKAKREEAVRSVIFNIAEASSKAKNPGEFYPYIHHEIRRLIDTPNFYIAVYDADSDEVTFPYYTDAEDSTYIARTSRKRKAGKGLTEHCIKGQKPLLLSKTDILVLNDRGHVNVSGQPIPECWVGVPLLHEDRVVGLITIQNYDVPDAYSQDDLALVNFVASQVAQFVAKLQADEHMRMSEERFRSIYKQAAVGIAQLTPEGNFLEVNQQMAAIFGYSVPELLTMMPVDFTHPDDADLGRNELIEVMEGIRPSYSKEKRYIHKDGHTVHALLNVSCYREEDEPIFVISVYEDITDKKRAQSENDLLLRLSSGLNAAMTMDDALAITLLELAGSDEWGYAEGCWRDLTGTYRSGTKQVLKDETLRPTANALISPAIQGAALSGHVIWGDQPEAAFFQPIISASLEALPTNLAILPILHEGRPIVLILLLSRKESIYRQSLERLYGAVQSQLVAVHLRKMEEAARIESENRYRAITQAAFEGIAIFQGSRILDCNAAFARLFDYTTEEILCMDLDDLVLDMAIAPMVAQLARGDRSGVEFTGRKKDGSAISMEAIAREDQWHGQEARILAVRDITSQKLMEETREAARLDARFKAYIQNSAEIIKIIDADGHIQYCSPSYSKIFEAQAETLIGLSNVELIVPEDRAAYLLALQAVHQRSEESQQLQLRSSSPSGGIRVLQATLTNLMDDPMIKGILISEGDITHVIEAQASRQESEQRFKLLFERSPDAIYVESADGEILDVNEAACNLQEMTREELVGLNVIELASPGNQETLRSGFEELMTGNLSYLQGETQTKSGKIIEVEIRCSLIVFQNLPALLLIVRDISQRKHEQLLLKESEERFRTLVEHATEAIFVIDVAGDRLVEANKNAETIFGRNRENLLMISPLALSPAVQMSGESSRELQAKAWERALAGELVVQEWLFLNAEDEEIPCEIRLLRFPSATQQLVRASVTDITDRKQAELKMQRSREILRLQNERLIELAASDALNSGDLDLAFEEITKAISDLLGVTLAGIWLFDSRWEHLICRKEYDAGSGEFRHGREVAVTDFPRYFALMQRQRVIAEEDAPNAESVIEFRETSIIPNNIRSVLDAPFRHGGRIAGMIWTMQLHVPRAWEPEELNFVASMADMVTLALQSWERKKAESELASTLTKMQATFESTRDGILLLDPQGFLLDHNEEYCNLSHIPKEELQNGLPYPGWPTMLAQIVDFEQFQEARERIEAHPEAEERFVYQTHSGQVIEMYGRQLIVEGKYRGMLWFLHDITDLKRIEKALLENETKFRSLFSQANDAIILLDDSTFVECNNKAEEMWGLTREQLIGQKSYDLSPEFQPDGRRSIEKAAENTLVACNGDSQRFYWQHKRGNGQPFDAEVSLNSIQIGEKVYVQALVRDITERLQTEHALRDSERNNKALLDGIPDLIVRITVTGQILDYKQSDSEGQLRIANNAVGMSILDVLPTNLAEKVLLQAQEAIAQGRSLQIESELKLNDEDLDYETRIVRSGANEVLAIIRDVTERKRTEKELIKRNFELDSFVYRASHDLKAPLNSLMGLITLVEGETQEPQVLAYIKMMNKSVVKLDSFIRDLADFSRNARLELAQSRIDWQTLLNETMENLQFADGADRIQKNIDIQDNGNFYSDPVRISIIFNNLISNAIKYQNLRRNDGFVTIQIASGPQGATITIADNGIGIPKEHQAKVYNLFFRASIQSYGSGMGMYIVKHAVDRMKGTIDMTSEEGVGTSYVMTLPDLGEPLPA